MPLRETVRSYIEKHQMIACGDTVIIAVSGGPDSLCLAHVLYSLQEKLNFTVRIAHFNHRFRGIAADADAAYVSQWCMESEIPYNYGEAEVAVEAEKTGESFEMAARRLRYQFLEELAGQYGARRIAVGHHRGDQAETVLMNLMRGSGLDGLAGIRPVRDQRIIRPLLGVSRSEIERYCIEHQLIPRVDHTNSDTEYTRNRIRLETIPLLKTLYNPNLEEALSRTAALLADDADYIGKQTNEVFQRLVQAEGDGLRMNLREFNQLHAAIQRRILRGVVHHLRGNRMDFSNDAVEQIRELSLRKQSGKHFVFRDLNFQIVYEELWIRPIPTQLTAEFREQKVPIAILPLIVETDWGTLSVDSEPLESLPDTLDRGPWSVLLDRDSIVGDLRIRSRRAGDQFWPLGASGRRKLKEYLIDRKIPRGERDKIPILCDSEKILWVGGCMPDHRVRIVESTENVLSVRLEVRCSKSNLVLE